LENNQKTLEQQAQETLTQGRAIAEKIDTLPDTFTTWPGSGLRETLTELITSSNTSKHDLEELRKLNAEYQIQLTKARSSYGQVRVEKDALNEKLAIVEGDRDRLRFKIKDSEEAASAKATETSALEARNTELEDALAKALARLQAADVATQADQRTIADLEKSKKEVDVEKECLKTKVSGYPLI
jgi:chromosome segregation ATPase